MAEFSLELTIQYALGGEKKKVGINYASPS